MYPNVQKQKKYNECNLPDEFTSFFKDKVENIVNEKSIQNDLYNGTKKT